MQDLNAILAEITGKVEVLLAGRIPPPIPVDDLPAGAAGDCAAQFNRLIECLDETVQAIKPLSAGNLDGFHLSRENFLASPFRELHSRLRNLTWQAQQVAEGDYHQRVDFMGEFSEAFNSMVEALRKKGDALETRILEVESFGRELTRTNRELSREVAMRRYTEEQLLKAKDAAEAANVAKSRFLANMSHEIRTPMTAILGYVDLLADPVVTPAEFGDYLAIIRHNGNHLLGLINDILDLSKVESGQLQVDLGPCDVADVVSEVIGTFAMAAQRGGVSLAAEYATEVPERVTTDAFRLRQVLVNLVSNAMKFTDSGSIRIIVSHRPGRLAVRSVVRIDVVDTGIGIEPDAIGTLFQPFVQVDGSLTRRHGGAGLGLTISRNVAKLMGGDLTVVSELGKGSTFSLTFLAAAVREAQVEETPASAALPAAGRLAGVKLLLAEDQSVNQRLITTVLRKAGADVAVADNGRAAVEAAIGADFDVVLMDLQMPEMDGCQALRALRAARFGRPVVAVTAHAMSRDRIDCLVAGFDDYLSKPIDRGKLIDTVAQWATRSRAGSASKLSDPAGA